MRVHPFTLALPALGLLAACDAPPPTGVTRPMEQPTQLVQPLSRPIPGANDVKERQMAFLNRIRAADPQQHTIDRAMLNEQNELGLILDRSVEMDKVPALLRSMLAQMAKEFPGQDLTVLAYTPSNPPHKIGTAHLNAQTRDMTYTPEG